MNLIRKRYSSPLSEAHDILLKRLFCTSGEKELLDNSGLDEIDCGDGGFSIVD